MSRPRPASALPPTAAKPRAAKGPGEGKAGRPARPPKLAAFDGWCLDGAIRPPAAVVSFDLASATVGFAVLSERLAPIAFGVLHSGAKDEETRTTRLIDAVFGVAREWPGVPVVCEITKGVRYGLRARSTDLATLARSQGRLAQSLIDAGRRVEMVHDVTWTGAGGSRPKPERAAKLRMIVPEYGRWVAAGHDEGMDAADALGIGLFWLGCQSEADLIARGMRGRKP